MSGATPGRACAQCGGPSERFFCSEECSAAAWAEVKARREDRQQAEAAAPVLRDALHELLVGLPIDECVFCGATAPTWNPVTQLTRPEIEHGPACRVLVAEDALRQAGEEG